MTAASFQSLVSRFLLDYLPNRRGFSPNTVASYRDAIALLLTWFASEASVPADDVGMGDLTPAAVSRASGRSSQLQAGTFANWRCCRCSMSPRRA